MHRHSLVRDLFSIWGALLVSGLLLFGVPGCTTLNHGNSDATKLAVQYGTLKLISSDNVSAEQVASRIDLVRSLLDEDEEDALLSLDNLVEGISGSIDWPRLDAADTLLLLSLIDQVANAVADVSLGGPVLDESQRVRLRTLLDWIEQAAAMAE